MIGEVLMMIDREAAIGTASALATALAGLLWKRFLDDRVKLIRYLTHASSIPVTPPGQQPVTLDSHTMVVRNQGRKAATNVRLGHIIPAGKPQGIPPFSMWPNLQYKVEGTEIQIPVLAPKEQVTITYIYQGALVHTLNTYEKCDQCLAERVDVQPTALLRPSVARTMWIVLFVGAATLVYFVLQLLWWFLTRTSP